MRWRHAAAAAVGVGAALGLSANAASADEVPASDPPAIEEAVPETPPTTEPAPAEPTPPESTTTTTVPRSQEDQRLDRARAAVAASGDVPVGTGPVRPRVRVIPLTEAEVPVEPTEAVPTAALVGLPIESGRPSARIGRQVAPIRGFGHARASHDAGAAPVASPDGEPTDPSPADAPGVPAGTPAAPATTSAQQSSPPAPTALPPADVVPPTSGDGSMPVWAIELADQRLAEKWRTAPVRGPPPSVATALGNQSTNDVTQVAVVRTRYGSEVVLGTSQSQTSDVSNVGTATAEAHGGGSATAAGNQASTSVIQVSVIVQKGSGTASVSQAADVDNVGVATAATEGPASATAVGNASTTRITQVAVVYVEGSGDAHVTQSAEVDNVGVATAGSTTRSSTAVGNQASTDVTQVSVVHVGDDDVAVGQASSDSNIGVATATGGWASGNTSRNTTTQVVDLDHR